MKAMILAAGLGTRLQPFTLTKPKALVPVNGIPVLEIIIRRLKKYGISEIIINVHHFADQIREFLSFHHNFDISIDISDETSQLLETGGGLVKAGHFFNDGNPFLVHNVDVLTDFNIAELYEYHLKNKSLATLAVKERKTSRSLLINKEHQLCGWKNNQTGETIIARNTTENLIPIAFSCVYVLNPEIFTMITETGKFSIMDSFLRLATNYNISTWPHPQNFWYDIGKAENLAMAEPFVNMVI
jgi:NDP-sugar pyrophosphorylase family protein